MCWTKVITFKEILEKLLYLLTERLLIPLLLGISYWKYFNYYNHY